MDTTYVVFPLGLLIFIFPNIIIVYKIKVCGTKTKDPRELVGYYRFPVTEPTYFGTPTIY